MKVCTFLHYAFYKQGNLTLHCILFSEGKAVLDRAIKRSLPTTLPALSPASTTATAHLLLASLSHKGKAPEQAVEHYAKALQDDPWLWEAFTGLCDIGSPPPPALLFPEPAGISRSSPSRTSRPPTLSPNPMPRSSASEIPGLITRHSNHRRQLSPLANGGGGFFTPDVVHAVNGISRLGMKGKINAWETPAMPGDSTFPIININEHSSVPAPTRRPLPNIISAFIPAASSMLPASFRMTSTPSNGDPLPAKPPAMKRPRGGNGIRRPVEPSQDGMAVSRELRAIKSIEPNGEEAPRRSSRLKSTPTIPVSKLPGEKRATRSRSATSSASGATVDIPSTTLQDAQLQSAADDWLRDIVRRAARAYRAISAYQCVQALREVDTLPPEIQSSAWAIDIVARSMYEMANYVLARRAFSALLNLEPYRLESMEAYSTLLWHL
ncbi:MAG: anaphase-promoting complex subunit cdc27, partial [Tremellales sp. Tagirdzhanova-0007]